MTNLSDQTNGALNKLEKRTTFMFLRSFFRQCHIIIAIIVLTMSHAYADLPAYETNTFAADPVALTTDTQMLEIFLYNKPIRITTKTSESISVSSSNGATRYRYQLNEGSIVENSISQPIVLTSLSIGAYTLFVYGGNDQSFQSDVTPITWTLIHFAFADNAPLSITTVLSGQESQVYSTNCSEKDVVLEWNVQNINHETLSTATGNTFSFTAPITGAFAGEYTVCVDAKVDNAIIGTLYAMIQVPFTIETNRNNLFEQTMFRAKGIEPFAKLTWKRTSSPEINEDLDEIGEIQTSSADPMALTFTPASLDEVTTFYMKCFVKNDKDLSIDNGLNETVNGPYTIIPTKSYTVTMADESGYISPVTHDTITIKEMVTGSSQTLAAGQSKIVFNLPASGGTYFFEIIDNQMPPVYMDFEFQTSSREATVLLEPIGTYKIEGVVTDIQNNVLEDFTVAAFREDDPYGYVYDAKIKSNGAYTIYFPDLYETDGWHVIAGKEGYASSLISDHQLDMTITTVSFVDTNGLQESVQITDIWTESNRIYIRSDPAFKANDKIEIYVNTENKETYIDQMNHENNLIYFPKPEDTDDFTFQITVKSSENQPILYHAYRQFSSGNVIKRVDKTLDQWGGSVSLTHENQTMSVEIPIDGITQMATITIEKITAPTGSYASIGSEYMYAVHATNAKDLYAQPLLSDEINLIAVTIPFDLKTIYPGDFENMNFYVYRADSVDDMINHQTERILAIKQSDYLGDGNIGYVTVWVDKLAVFAIGTPAPASSETTDLGGDCFIDVLQTNGFVSGTWFILTCLLFAMLVIKNDIKRFNYIIF